MNKYNRDEKIILNIRSFLAMIVFGMIIYLIGEAIYLKVSPLFKAHPKTVEPVIRAQDATPRYFYVTYRWDSWYPEGKVIHTGSLRFWQAGFPSETEICKAISNSESTKPPDSLIRITYLYEFKSAGDYKQFISKDKPKKEVDSL